MKINRLPIFASAALVIAIFTVVGCQPTETQSEDDLVLDDPIVRGEMHYVMYCQNCHGADAKGNGPVAELLKYPPSDLTTISARNGGSFPVDQLAAWIDGREGTEMHGTREMPVWGNIWTDNAGGADVEQGVSAQINELVEYIRSIQAPAS